MTAEVSRRVVGVAVAMLIAAALGVAQGGTRTNEEREGQKERLRNGEAAMKGYTTNIQRDTLDNEDYRRVLYTGKHMQLVLMTLRLGEAIGIETHEEHDQFIRIEAGTAVAVLDGAEVPLAAGSVVVIPAGVEHNVTNTSGDTPLKLYTLYSPPEHPDGTVHRTKQDGDH